MKFAIGFAAAPIGVNMVAWAYGEAAGGAPALFAILAMMSAVMLAAALLLPHEAVRLGSAAPAAAPAE